MSSERYIPESAVRELIDAHRDGLSSVVTMVPATALENLLATVAPQDEAPEQEGLREATASWKREAARHDEWPRSTIDQAIARTLRACAAHVNSALARPAAAEGVENEDSGMWLLQDLRSIVGNSMLWWNKDGKGYGCDVHGAHRFTREEALFHVQAYDRLRAYPADYIVGLAKHHIDFQYVDRDRALTPDDGEGQADG